MSKIDKKCNTLIYALHNVHKRTIKHYKQTTNYQNKLKHIITKKQKIGSPSCSNMLCMSKGSAQSSMKRLVLQTLSLYTLPSGKLLDTSEHFT
jgi:hypothetical protein